MIIKFSAPAGQQKIFIDTDQRIFAITRNLSRSMDGEVRASLVHQYPNMVRRELERDGWQRVKINDFGGKEQ